MYNTRMHERSKESLREDQLQKSESQESNIFHSYLYSNFGGKHFAMTLWQTGMTTTLVL